MSMMKFCIGGGGDCETKEQALEAHVTVLQSSDGPEFLGLLVFLFVNYCPKDMSEKIDLSLLNQIAYNYQCVSIMFLNSHTMSSDKFLTKIAPSNI